MFEDWLFHALLPAVAYAILAGASFAARLYEARALFGVAAASMLLLFIGIHNAWDTATYLVYVRRRDQDDSRKRRS